MEDSSSLCSHLREREREDSSSLCQHPVVHLAMILEARLLPEGLSTDVTHIGLLPGVYVLMVPQGLPGGKGLGTVFAGKGFQLEMHGAYVRLQLELAGKETSAVLARHLLGIVHQHVLHQHKALGHPPATHLALVQLLHLQLCRVLLQRVVLEGVAGVELFLADAAVVTLVVNSLRFRLGWMLGASMIFEIR